MENLRTTAKTPSSLGQACCGIVFPILSNIFVPYADEVIKYHAQ